MRGFRWLQDQDIKIVLGIIAIVVIPAVLTLDRVVSPMKPSDMKLIPDPTPLGYTVSLLIYLVPVLAIQWWFFRKFKEGDGVVRRSARAVSGRQAFSEDANAYRPDYRRSAYRRTLVTLIPIGFGLDIVLGHAFLTFENVEATLFKYRFPAFSFESLSFVPHIPVEEFVFYTLGFMAILSVYIWCDEYWLERYNVPDYHIPPGTPGRGLPPFIAQVQLQRPLVISVAVVGAAWLYKKYGWHEFHDGFPSYLTFLVAASLFPSILLFRSTRRFINWQAVSFTVFWVLLTSLIWEATLAAPYGWWGYQPWHMVGVFIGAWFRLPIEAALLWVAATFTTVMVFEAYKILISMKRESDIGWREALFGKDFRRWLADSFLPSSTPSQIEHPEGTFAKDVMWIPGDRS